MDLIKLPKPFLIIIGIAFVTSVLTLIGIVKLSNLNPVNKTLSTPVKITKNSVLKQTLTIDIQGAIYKPGVYQLPQNSRMLDALKKGQGLTEQADRYLIAKTFNLAKLLIDEEKIYIPYLDERNFNDYSGQTNTLISINSASETQLELLPGIGPVRAQAIADNRPYSTIEELVSKKVLGEATLNKIINLISL